MTIVLYNNTSEKNVLNKASHLTQVASLTGTLRSGTNLVDPEIIVELATLPNFNYAYISEFNRYYFVKNITNVNNRLWSISLHCDVLYSFKNSILNMKCDVERNEFDYDLLLEDRTRTIEDIYDVDIIEAEGEDNLFAIPESTLDLNNSHSIVLYAIK